jgi:hypothetical protein
VQAVFQKVGNVMTVASLNLGRRQFVVVPQSDFARLQQDSAALHQLLQEDAALGKLADRELRAFKRRGGKGVPWSRIKRELGF